MCLCNEFTFTTKAVLRCEHTLTQAAARLLMLGVVSGFTADSGARPGNSTAQWGPGRTCFPRCLYRTSLAGILSVIPDCGTGSNRSTGYVMPFPHHLSTHPLWLTWVISPFRGCLLSSFVKHCLCFPAKNYFPIDLSGLYPCLQTKSLQSCLTLCNPVDCSPSGSSVCGILHEQESCRGVAIPYSKGLYILYINPSSIMHVVTPHRGLSSDDDLRFVQPPLAAVWRAGHPEDRCALGRRGTRPGVGVGRGEIRQAGGTHRWV